MRRAGDFGKRTFKRVCGRKKKRRKKSKLSKEKLQPPVNGTQRETETTSIEKKDKNKRKAVCSKKKKINFA